MPSDETTPAPFADDVAITVRFDERTRQVLEAEAAARGVGSPTLVRQFAEAELKRVRRARIAAEAAALEAYLAEHRTAFDDDNPAEWFRHSRASSHDVERA